MIRDDLYRETCALAHLALLSGDKLAFFQGLAALTDPDTTGVADSREYIAVGINCYTSNGGDIGPLVRTAIHHKGDPSVDAVCNWLAEMVRDKDRDDLEQFTNDLVDRHNPD